MLKFEYLYINNILVDMIELCFVITNSFGNNF